MRAVTSVVSDSLLPYGLKPTRVFYPWDSPGKNIGVACHVLLQGIFLSQGLNLHLLCLLRCRWILYPLSHLGSPSQGGRYISITRGWSKRRERNQVYTLDNKHVTRMLLGPWEDESGTEEGLWWCVSVLLRITGWQSCTIPHSNQSHVGWPMLSAHQPAGLNNSIVSHITSTGWVRWLECYSYISSLFKGWERQRERETRILFYFSLIFFRSCYQVAQNNWNKKVTITAFFQLLLSLFNIWFSSL